MKNIFLFVSCFIVLFSCQKKEVIQPAPKIEREFIDDPLVYEVINAVLEMPEISEYKPEYMLNISSSLDFLFDKDRYEFYEIAKKYFGENDTLNIQSNRKI